MKQILIFISLFLAIVCNINAQSITANQFNGRLQMTTVSNVSDSTWSITGYFTNSVNKYTTTQIAVNDKFFCQIGANTYVGRISVINSASDVTKLITFRVICNYPNPPNNIGAIVRATSNGYPVFVDGLPNALQAGIQNYFATLVNTNAAGSPCEQTITKASHGFRKGTPIRWNGSTYVRPTNDTLVPDFVVVDSLTANTFKVANCGTYTTALANGLYWFTSASPGYSLTADTTKVPLFQALNGKLILNPIVGFNLMSGGGAGDVTSSVLADTAAAIRADFPSGVSDGDKGDITVSSGAWTIDNGVISNTKLATNAVDSTKAANLALSDIDIISGSVGQVPTITASGLKYRTPSAGSVTLTKSTYGDSIKVNGSPVEDNANLFNDAFINQNNLKWYPAKVYDQQAGTDDINVILLGDSKTEFPFIPTAFKNTFQRSFIMDGNGYAGLYGAGFMLPNMSQTNTPTTAGWTIKTKSSGGRGLNMYSVVSGGGSTAFTATATGVNNQYNRFTQITIYWWGQVGGGTFTLSIDAVVVATINTSSATGFQSTTVSGFTDTFHNITITPSGANAEILGISTGRGINGMRFHAVGQSGAVASEYIALDTTNWNPQLRALSPKLVCIHLGTNERSGDVLPATFKTNIKLLISRIKVATKYTTDICLFGIADNNQTKVYTTEQYNEVLRQVANEDTLAFFDINKLAGKFAINKKKGDNGWLTDGVHEGDMAGSIIADNFSAGLPSNNKVNTSEIFRQTFGFSTPVNATQTAGRVLYSDATTGTVTTTGNLAYNGVTLTQSGGNFSSAGTITGITGLIAGSPYYAGGTLRHGGNGNIGYFGFVQNQTGLAAGYQQGVRVDGASQPVRFFASNQGAPLYNWVWENFAGIERDISNQGTRIMRWTQGIGNIGTSNRRVYYLDLNYVINQTVATSGHTIVGLRYAPILTSVTGVRNVAAQFNTGDVILASVSGNVGIGRDTATSADITARLHIGAGTATASTAPLKFTSGTNLTTAEAGAIEYDGTEFYATNSTASRTTLARVLKGSGTLSFPLTPTGTSSSLTITVTGAATTDSGVSIQRTNASISGTFYEAVITGANTVTVYFHNFSGSDQTPASGTFRATVTK